MQEQFQGHNLQRKINNLLTDWESRPYWKFFRINNLYLLPIGPSPSHKIPSQKLQKSANKVQISTLDSKQNLAIWYHRICFSPVVTTCIKAINAGFFSSQNTCLPQSILPWATSANNTKTTGKPNKLRSLFSHPSSIKNQQCICIFPAPQHNLFRPNRRFPHHFQSRILLINVCICIRHPHNPHALPEYQVWCRTRYRTR